jgi:hypothetical protein
MGAANRYYVDIYDAFDGWGIWGFGRAAFDTIDEARACRDQLNAELAEENKSAGEHWRVIDGAMVPKSIA